jgi:hypothetical protein
MEKWTKGLEFRDAGEYEYLDGIECRYEVRKKKEKGQLWGESVAYVCEKEEALLFSAAPDLYAALKECVRIMDKGESGPDDLENVYQAAVAALDKANGG